jgi:hypothetical protein
MTTESVIIAHLREQAKGERTTGDAHHANAEAFERAADLLAAKAGGEAAPVQAAATSAANVVRRTGGKGKPPGSLSQRWRGNFADIIRSVPAPHVFGFNHVQSAIKLREGRDMRTSEIRRLFKVSVDNGYLVQPSRDLYQPTQKLIDLIGLKKHEGPPATTEGPSAGGVAERSIASDSKSDGVTLEPAPVGSNPTASAPAQGDVFARLGLPVSTTPNQ